MSKVADELKPCPFCGSKAESDLIGGSTPAVWCSNEKCGVMLMDLESPWLDDVEKQWNTRPAHD